jgi:hypothetical protein
VSCVCEQISWEEFKAGCDGSLEASACAAFAGSLLGAIEVVSKHQEMATFDNQVRWCSAAAAPPPMEEGRNSRESRERGVAPAWWWLVVVVVVVLVAVVVVVFAVLMTAGLAVQVAGHKGKDAMLKEATNILKPLAAPEFEFYEQVRKLPDDVQVRLASPHHSSPSPPPVVMPIRCCGGGGVVQQKFFPAYFGRRSMTDPSGYVHPPTRHLGGGDAFRRGV